VNELHSPVAATGERVRADANNWSLSFASTWNQISFGKTPPSKWPMSREG